MSEYHLRTELTRHNSLADRLAKLFPEIDEDTFCDTLEGLTTLPEQLAELIRSTLADEDLGAALRLRLAEMRSRLERLQTRAEKKRALAAEIMSEAGFKRLEQPEFTVILRAAPPALQITDEAQIPPIYFKPQPPKLDRALLLLSLKSGEPVAGAALTPASTSVTVRCK